MPLVLLALALMAAPDAPSRVRHPWLTSDAPRTLESTFAAPKGFTRIAEEPGSFGAYLRDLPLQAADSPVLAFNGETVRTGSDPRVAAVAALDIGDRDLQQCADSIIRLHAEWKWFAGASGDLGYNLTSGSLASWRDWSAGQRPKVAGSKVTWSASAPPDGSHASYRRWLDFVFTYAGTRSLWAYAKPVERAQLRPGDFFVMPSTKDYGHAVLVLDVAEDGKGHRLALLGQGFVPAQSFHVLASAPGNPWFSLEGDQVATPFWAPFPWANLRRLP